MTERRIIRDSAITSTPEDGVDPWTVSVDDTRKDGVTVSFTDPAGEAYQVGLAVVDGVVQVAAQSPVAPEASILHMTRTGAHFAPRLAAGTLIDDNGKPFPAQNFVPRQVFGQQPHSMRTMTFQDWRIADGETVSDDQAREWRAELSAVEFPNHQDLTVVDPDGNAYRVFARIDDGGTLSVVAMDTCNGLGVHLVRKGSYTTIGPLDQAIPLPRGAFSFSHEDQSAGHLFTDLSGLAPVVVARPAGASDTGMTANDGDVAVAIEIEAGHLRVLFYTPEHEDPTIGIFGSNEIRLRDPSASAGTAHSPYAGIAFDHHGARDIEEHEFVIAPEPADPVALPRP